MPGLSAKVFRTYNASVTLEAELEELPIDAKESDKKMEYDRANREVAILCNHQRTVPKAFFVAQEASRRKEALLIAQLIELKDMSERVSWSDGGVARLRREMASTLALVRLRLHSRRHLPLARCRSPRASPSLGCAQTTRARAMRCGRVWTPQRSASMRSV